MPPSVRTSWLWRAFGFVAVGSFLLSLWASVLVAAYANWRCGWQLRPRAQTRIAILADPQMVGEPPAHAPWLGEQPPGRGGGLNGALSEWVSQKGRARKAA